MAVAKITNDIAKIEEKYMIFVDFFTELMKLLS